MTDVEKGFVKDVGVSKKDICVEHPTRGNGVKYNQSLDQTASKLGQ